MGESIVEYSMYGEVKNFLGFGFILFDWNIIAFIYLVVVWFLEVY